MSVIYTQEPGRSAQQVNSEHPLPVHQAVDLPSISQTFNITLTSADTQYSQVIPAGCQHFEWQARTAAAVRYALDDTGKVATPTAPYHTLKAGDYYYSPRLSPQALARTLYLASATAGTVIELLVWV